MMPDKLEKEILILDTKSVFGYRPLVYQMIKFEFHILLNSHESGS